jgi:predicted DNA-binding transcriptional regulator YafY
MPRKDRLHALLATLRDGQSHTAAEMARDHGVSERTIYRDMAQLAAAGVAVEGTQGQGYRVRPGITLPPLSLSETELEALMLALAALSSSALDQAAAAQALSARIEALLPEDGSAPPIPDTGGFADNPRGLAHMPAIRAAVQARQRLRIARGARTDIIRPLNLEYWGRAWRCVAWSETDNAFLTFALDQLSRLSPLPGLFVDEPGKTLDDWRAQSS